MATATQYLDQLTALLPGGRAWSREPGSVLSRLLGGLSEAFARVHAAADDLLIEADPRTTVQLLDAWERMAGLPDPCAGLEQTLEGRRRRLVAQLTEVGGQSRAYFVALAAEQGQTVTIDEFRVARCTGACNDPINGEEWAFIWQVKAPANRVEDATCVGFCNEPLRIFGDTVIECLFEARKPAHTTILWTYEA